MTRGLLCLELVFFVVVVLVSVSTLFIIGTFIIYCLVYYHGILDFSHCIQYLYSDFCLLIKKI